MTTLIGFSVALVASLAGIVYLLVTDEKRLRARGAQHLTRWPKRKSAAWAVVILPGLLLLLLGQASAFLVWFGSVTVCAWLIASQTGPAGRPKPPTGA